MKFRSLKFRSLGFVLFIVFGFILPAAAQQRSAGGEWTGKYVCGQGVTGARLILSPDGSRGVFHFYPLPENPRVPEGCFQVSGVSMIPRARLRFFRPVPGFLRPANTFP